MIAGRMLRMWRKKKAIIRMVVGVVILLSVLSACGKKQTQPNVPLQDLIIEYSLDNMLAYAAAEDGTVYAVDYDLSGEEGVYGLHRFNGQGMHEESISLQDYSMVEAMAVSEDGKQVYFTAQDVEFGLFSYSVEDSELTMLCGLPYFDRVKQLAVVGDVVYLLGQSPNWQSAKAPDFGYSFAGERLVAYGTATGEQVQLGFDFPVSMSASGVGTLIVFGYLTGDGYCMMEYDPAEDSVQVISRLENYKFSCFAACNGGKNVIYDYTPGSRGLVISDIQKISVEADLYPASLTLRMPSACVGGLVYCWSTERHALISFPLDAVQKNNKELTFISREYGALNAPYGCGYSINRVELSDEKLTLKILARDKDYDLCMGDTLLGSGRNLRENGVFYPLNDVPEIQEYLERCFPYVREAATKEDGTVWMLPVKVNVYGMVVRQKEAQAAGLHLYNGMTWEEYAGEILGAEEKYRKRIEENSSYSIFFFGKQYFARYHTLEGGVFTGACTALSSVCGADWGEEAKEGNYILEMPPGSLLIDVGEDYKRERYGEDAAFIAMPKLSSADDNIANCVFLAVNPDSARRDEALAYLAALAAYLTQRGDLPFFMDWQGESMLDETLHKAYENGEVCFAVDYDVYGEGFDELFSGELELSEYIKKTEPKLRMYWGE